MGWQYCEHLSTSDTREMFVWAKRRDSRQDHLERSCAFDRRLCNTFARCRLRKSSAAAGVTSAVSAGESCGGMKAVVPIDGAEMRIPMKEIECSDPMPIRIRAQ